MNSLASIARVDNVPEPSELHSTLPSFPFFRSLRREDAASIGNLVLEIPYSDFNFTSLWCWNTNGMVGISELDGNLALRLPNYIDIRMTYSLNGCRITDNTVKKFIQFMSSTEESPELVLLPAEVVDKLALNWRIEDDRANYDYIFTIERLCDYSSPGLRRKRYLVNRFKRDYQATVCQLAIQQPQVRLEIQMLLEKWVRNKHLEPQQYQNEFQAIYRFLDFAKDARFICVGIYIGGVLVGFAAAEVLGKGNAIVHFEKADIQYIGVYAFLLQETAKALRNVGCRFVNLEQDLGVPGFRQCKLSFKPFKMLKKYKLVAVRGE